MNEIFEHVKYEISHVDSTNIDNNKKKLGVESEYSLFVEGRDGVA